eukprot:TRINITY_DN16828_c0_g1_i1.p1 TRINITY_DN16828_c0_g1~~TRINITY_DN16828_c0_g1_i1.p1  ORF type:complete len:200 (+),score=19.79 TRINITY_DN16828_c0_g1_i1:712-1311(+)
MVIPRSWSPSSPKIQQKSDISKEGVSEYPLSEEICLSPCHLDLNVPIIPIRSSLKDQTANVVQTNLPALYTAPPNDSLHTSSPSPQTKRKRQAEASSCSRACRKLSFKNDVNLIHEPSLLILFNDLSRRITYSPEETCHCFFLRVLDLFDCKESPSSYRIHTSGKGEGKSMIYDEEHSVGTILQVVQFCRLALECQNST